MGVKNLCIQTLAKMHIPESHSPKWLDNRLTNIMDAIGMRIKIKLQAVDEIIIVRLWVFRKAIYS
jgi:hypothetical protein